MWGNVVWEELYISLSSLTSWFTENCHIYLKTFMDFFLSILSTVSQPTEIFPHDTLIVNTHTHTLCQLSW